MLQLQDSDQEIYKDFPLTISERWQQEIAETVFEAINQAADGAEAKKRAKKLDEESKYIETLHIRGWLDSMSSQKALYFKFEKGVNRNSGVNRNKK